MFRNLRKKTKKILNWKEKSFYFFLSCPSFVFAPYLISPNLHIILKKIKLRTQVDLKEAP